jgi:hypothetical protein
MKRFILLIMLSQVVFCAEAKQKNVEEGVDVYSTHSNTYNAIEPRSESISADITGHVLTNLRI